MLFGKAKILRSHGWQYIPDLDAVTLTEEFRGFPILSETKEKGDIERAAKLCPTGSARNRLSVLSRLSLISSFFTFRRLSFIAILSRRAFSFASLSRISLSCSRTLRRESLTSICLYTSLMYPGKYMSVCLNVVFGRAA